MKKGLAILLLSAGLIGYGAVSGLFESQPVVASYIANDYMGAILHIDTVGVATTTAVDSIATLLSAPAVVEVATGQSIFSNFQSDTTSTDWYRVGPPLGIDIDGGRGILVTITATDIGTTAGWAAKDDVSFFPVFSNAAADTACYTYLLGNAADSILVKGADMYKFRRSDGTFPTITFYVPCPADMFVGKFYLRMHSAAGLTVIEGMNVTCDVVK